MNEDLLLGRLEALAPFADRNEARRAFDATLQSLRRGLSDDEADWLAVALGPALSAPLLRETYAGELSADELYRWTKRNAKARKSVAVEQAQTVCRALGELLQPPELERLKRHLPLIAPLLTVPDPAAPPPPPRRIRSVPSAPTLAGGRPGSSRPLSDAGEANERAAGRNKPDLARTQKVLIAGGEARVGSEMTAEATGDSDESPPPSTRGFEEEDEEFPADDEPRSVANLGHSSRR
jgi:uncharacterized protein (DUF2267 family)